MTLTISRHNYRQRRTLYGPSRIDSASTVAILGYARAAGIGWREIAKQGEMQDKVIQDIAAGNRPVILRHSAERIAAAVEVLLRARLEAVTDGLASIARAKNARPAPTCRWPIGPLHDAIKDSGIPVASVLNGNDRRYLYRSETLSDEAAESYCDAFGLDPWELWPNWYEVAE